MNFPPYDIGFTKGDLVTTWWYDDVGLVTDILWGKPSEECLPTWVTVLWAGKGSSDQWDAEALKKVEESS